MENIGIIITKAAGSKKYFSELVDTYDKLVFSICYKIMGDYFAAEDLSQETFLTVFQKYSTFDGGNEKAWICRIATNKSIDYMRSAGRKNIPTEDGFFEAELERKNDPEKCCIEQEVKENLLKFCGMLKSPYDEIAVDYYLKEMTVAEIASKRHRNMKTIQTQIYRAKKMLQKLYRREESG